MAYATDSDLLARIPATSAVAVDLRGFALSNARNQISDALFGDQTVAAQCFLAAHILALTPGSGLSGGGGVVLSRSAGGIAATYAAPSGGALGPHSSTRYGQLFDQLAAGLPILSMAVDDPTGAWDP